MAYNGATPSVAPMGVTMDQMFAPQGFIGGALGSALGGLGGGAIGRAFGNQNLGRQIGNVAGGVLGGLLPFEAGPQAYAGTYYVPQTAAPGFAPQGIVGDALGAIGAPLGGFIGGRFGNAGLGQTIGGTVGGLAQRFLPFEAGPQQQPVYYYAPQSADPSFAPQGFIGDALGAVGGRVGNWIGGRFGNAGAGQTVGNVVGGLAQRFLPFDAGPQPYAGTYYVPQTAAPGFAPQGIVGDALGAIGAPLGGFIGGRFGNAGLGQTIGGTVGGLAQRFLPFEAAPGFAPQGIVGDALGAIGAPLGGFIGGRFGNAGLGQTIGGTVGGLAQRFLPFEAEPVFVPQGFIGDALGAVGGRVGNWIGGRFGNAGAGQTVGNVVGGLAQRFLPFEAGPQAGTYYVPQAAAPVFAPQGIVGDALGAIGAPLGGFIGGRFGNAGLGQTIGGTVGGLAQRFLPFDAAPQPVYYVPQMQAPMYG
ncbi:hypothetical protein [Methylocystis sp.]|uniref:hypothetical protein n=1 Tax=Methylocystis sp. TaxID=1911079 RepID=UPI002737700B|nr:hypothetical protein [Methylocystis sp.]MDP3553229.1 hypothetical protein [Methylocystis sp.]